MQSRCLPGPTLTPHWGPRDRHPFTAAVMRRAGHFPGFPFGRSKPPSMTDNYPIRVTPGTRTLSPGLFRRLVLPAHHRSWAETERVMLADPHERRRIEELEIELAGTGFERPVVIEREHSWSVRPRVCDGMHRSVASAATGGRSKAHNWMRRRRCSWSTTWFRQAGRR